MNFIIWLLGTLLSPIIAAGPCRVSGGRQAGFLSAIASVVGIASGVKGLLGADKSQGQASSAAGAQGRALEEMTEIEREKWDLWRNQVFPIALRALEAEDRLLGDYEGLTKEQIGLARQEIGEREQQLADIEDYVRPVFRGLAEDLGPRDAPVRKAAAEAHEAGDVAERSWEREMIGRGIDPSSPSYASGLLRHKRETQANVTGETNRAREDEWRRSMENRFRYAGFGTSAQPYGVTMQRGSSAGISPPGTNLGQIASGYGNLAGFYGNQANQYASDAAAGFEAAGRAIGDWNPFSSGGISPGPTRYSPTGIRLDAAGRILGGI